MHQNSTDWPTPFTSTSFTLHGELDGTKLVPEATKGREQRNYHKTLRKTRYMKMSILALNWSEDNVQSPAGKSLLVPSLGWQNWVVTHLLGKMFTTNAHSTRATSQQGMNQYNPTQSISYSTPKFWLIVPSLKTYSFNGLTQKIGALEDKNEITLQELVIST